MESGSTVCMVCFLNSTRDFVRSSEAWKEGDDNVAGLARSRPPSLTGTASRPLSAAEHDVCPVRAGIRCVTTAKYCKIASPYVWAVAKVNCQISYTVCAKLHC